MGSRYLRFLLYLQNKLEKVVLHQQRVERREQTLSEINKSFAKSLELQAPKQVSCKFTEDEIERMSSEEYYWKVLNPHGIKKEVAVTTIGGVCQ